MKEPLTQPGKRLREARTNKGLTQDELEDLSGVSQSRISYFETGTHRLENSGHGVLRRLARPLGVSVDFFFQDELDDAR